MQSNDINFSIQDTDFTAQIRELTHHFANIENQHIRQYALNLVREISEITVEQEAKYYHDDAINEWDKVNECV